MKKIIVIVLICFVISCVALSLPKTQEYDYLRLHIRANSNAVVDQNVKYEIKDLTVKYFSEYLGNVKSKKEAEDVVNRLSENLKVKCLNLLKSKGFNYSVNIAIKNEFFPTRTYSNTTLESGYYDAVIIELGEAKGDNWWCVMYPPLCFMNKNENTMQIKYKSKIVEWFCKLFK